MRIESSTSQNIQLKCVYLLFLVQFFFSFCLIDRRTIINDETIAALRLSAGSSANSKKIFPHLVVCEASSAKNGSDCFDASHHQHHIASSMCSTAWNDYTMEQHSTAQYTKNMFHFTFIFMRHL